MKKQMKRMLIGVGIVFGILFAITGVKKILFIWGISHYQPPAVTVSTTKAESKTWQTYLTAVGTLTAINGVDISSEVPGIVREIRFTSGQMVQQGDVLIILDTSVEQAELKSNQAKLKLAQLDFNRNQKLLQRNVTSQASHDASLASLQEAEAGVESVQARIKQKTITAPFTGKIGIRLVDLGQYISPGNAMVTLQALNPLFVRFNLPEQYIGDLYLGEPVDIEVDMGGKTVRGEVTAINAKVDQATRNMLVQATLPNASLELYPGMYALAKVWLKEKKNTIVLPQTAISYSLSGDYVFLVKEEGKAGKEPILHVYRQYVKVGEHRGEEVSIIDGLKAGEVIVTSGQLKLQNGSRVVINNTIGL